MKNRSIVDIGDDRALGVSTGISEGRGGAGCPGSPASQQGSRGVGESTRGLRTSSRADWTLLLASRPGCALAAARTPGSKSNGALALLVIRIDTGQPRENVAPADREDGPPRKASSGEARSASLAQGRRAAAGCGWAGRRFVIHSLPVRARPLTPRPQQPGLRLLSAGCGSRSATRQSRAPASAVRPALRAQPLVGDRTGLYFSSLITKPRNYNEFSYLVTRFGQSPGDSRSATTGLPQEHHRDSASTGRAAAAAAPGPAPRTARQLFC